MQTSVPGAVGHPDLAQGSCVISGGFLSLSGPQFLHLMKGEVGAVPTPLVSESLCKVLTDGAGSGAQCQLACAPIPALRPPKFPGLFFDF